MVCIITVETVLAVGELGAAELDTVVTVPGVLLLVLLGGIVVLAVLVGCSVGVGVGKVVDTGREVVDVGVVRDVVVAVGVGDGVLETVVVVPRVLLGGIVVLAVLVGASGVAGVGIIVDTGVGVTVRTVDSCEADRNIKDRQNRQRCMMHDWDTIRTE